MFGCKYSSTFVKHDLSSKLFYLILFYDKSNVYEAKIGVPIYNHCIHFNRHKIVSNKVENEKGKCVKETTKQPKTNNGFPKQR